MQKLIEIAREKGIDGFKADVLGENKKMLHVFHKCGYPVYSKLEEGVYSITIDFSDSPKK